MSVVKLQEEPYNIEAEQVILGGLLLARGTVGAVVGHGGADLFFDPVHADIFRIISERDKQGLVVSPVALGEVMRNHEGLAPLGGPGYFARLAGAYMAESFDECLSLASEAMAKRGLLAAMQQAQAALIRGEEQASAIAAQLEAALMGAVQYRDRSRPVSMLKAVSCALEAAYEAYNGETPSLVPSGIGALDDLIGGFSSGQMILIGGRPSMGKTGVALSVALNAARAGHGVIIVSLEMTPESMALRAISEQTSHGRNAVAYSDLFRGQVDEAGMRSATDAAREVARLPIQFLPRDYADIASMSAGIKQARKLLPPDRMPLVVVDYAQLLRSPAKSRYEQITEISIALKALAMRHELPVIALSQLSRAVEQRDDKRPMLSDLRESGQLEQDADTIMFCYRDEYYLERERPDPDARGEILAAYEDALYASRNKLEIIVAKQRQGAIGTAHVRFNPALNLIWEQGR